MGAAKSVTKEEVCANITGNSDAAFVKSCAKR